MPPLQFGSGGEMNYNDHIPESWEKAREQIHLWQNNGKKIVFTNGCFDILHVGHIRYLKGARNMGDYLIVGLNTDDSVKRLKGASRPYQSECDRAEILRALRFVDLVVLFSQDTPLEIITYLKPDILIKGGDYRIETIVGAREIMSWGGKVLTLPFVPEKSTSNLLLKIEKQIRENSHNH